MYRKRKRLRICLPAADRVRSQKEISQNKIKNKSQAPCFKLELVQKTESKKKQGALFCALPHEMLISG